MSELKSDRVNEMNSLVYRYIRAAYKLDSSDAKALWTLAGYEFSTSYVRRLMLDSSNPDHAYPSERQLKEFLVVLVEQVAPPVPGRNVRALLNRLAEINGLPTGRDTVQVALSIRDALRGGDHG